MPEAPEVSVAAHQLAHVATGRVLRSLTVTHPRTVRSVTSGALDRFVGRTVTAVHRHGKWLTVSFDGDPGGLGIHLRMSGQLLARSPGPGGPNARPAALEAATSGPGEPGARSPNHVHAVLELGRRATGVSLAPGVPGPPVGGAGASDDPVAVWFRDPRTFGELRVLEDGAPVAPDLFHPGVDAATLLDHAGRRRVGVKAVLLDQVHVVSGIGSYLADEALHRAAISPRRPAQTLAVTAWRRILDAARSVTRDATAVGGVTLPDEGWVDVWGRPGRFAPQLRVHGRATCGTCGRATVRAVVGGRSARWCPRCQDGRRRR